jgi:hypothetical protein
MSPSISAAVIDHGSLPEFMISIIRFLYYFSTGYLYSYGEDKSTICSPDVFRGCAMFHVSKRPSAVAISCCCLFILLLCVARVVAEETAPDTVRIGSIEVQPGAHTSLPIYLQNSAPVTGYCIPLHYNHMLLRCDSVTFSGTRTDDQFRTAINVNQATGEFILAAIAGSTSRLESGTGPVAELWVTADTTVADTLVLIDGAFYPPAARLHLVDASAHSAEPHFQSGSIYITEDLRGDANEDNRVNIADAVFLISYIFKDEDAPLTLTSGDANSDGKINIGDAVYIVNFIFRDGPPPGTLRSITRQPVILTFYTGILDDAQTVEIALESYVPVGGVQIEFTKSRPGNIGEAVTVGRCGNLQLFCFESESIVRIGLIDLNSGQPIPSGQGAIVRMPLDDNSNLEVASVVVSDQYGYQLPVKIRQGLSGQPPSSSSLDFNRPNPFNPSTIIDFAVSNPGWVTISIYNVLGQKIRTLTDRRYDAGRYRVSWDGLADGGGPAASGIYFYKMQSPGYIQTRKMVLLR